MKVRDAMSTRVVTAKPETLLADAMRTMLRERISGLPVLDAQGALVGVLTEGDLMRRAETGTEPTHPAWLRFLLGPGRMAREFTVSHARHVGEVMTHDVIAIGADASLEEAVPEGLSDAAIASRIVHELDTKSWTPRETMNVDVHGGVVTLRGVLLDDAVRDALVVLAENTTGVVRVVDQLTTVEPMMGMVVRAPGP